MIKKKHPVRVIKKKFTQKQTIYKICWSNGCTSYEPLADMTSDLMSLVQIYEINQVSKSDENLKQQLLLQYEEEQFLKKQIKQELEKEKKIKVNAEVISSDSFDDEYMPQPFQKKKVEKEPQVKSEQCHIKYLRKLTNQSNLDSALEFLGYFPQEKQEVWLNTRAMLDKSPIALCDFLLSKIKWTQNKKKS